VVVVVVVVDDNDDDDDDDDDDAVSTDEHYAVCIIRLGDSSCSIFQVNPTSVDRHAGDHLLCGCLTSTALHHSLPAQR